MNQVVARNEFGNELAAPDTASTAVAAQAKALVEGAFAKLKGTILSK